MDNEEEEIKKQVSQEFILTVKKYLEIDDNLNEIKNKMKFLNKEKKDILSEIMLSNQLYKEILFLVTPSNILVVILNYPRSFAL